MVGSVDGRAAPPRVLVLCAHLHEDRARKYDRDYLQPMAGLHIGSLLDRSKYRVSLYHEMWHGPYDTASIAPGDFALVFVTGLQMDFDRMRQLAYFFKRAGALVVAGGSLCTLFPDFARQFFDVVCAGGVECVVDVMRDYERGALKPVYSLPQTSIGDYTLDHRLMEEAGIRVPVHFIEASRGCNFKCDFCSIPAEGRTHVPYDLAAIARNIEDSIASSGRFSIKRRYPMVWFIDNNFSNNRAHLREICRRFSADRRIRMWGALVTQDVLRDRDLVRTMAAAKCRGIFAGIESFDMEFIAAHDKWQNVKGSGDLMADIAFAESLGMMIDYGYLFDPRMTGVERMKAEMRFILRSDVLNYPYFVAFVAPLAGTKLFWNALERGELLPNLRLRDLDGRCVAYRNTIDDAETLGAFAATIFGTPHIYFDRAKTLRRFFRHFWQHGRKNPILSYLFHENRARLGRLGRKHSKAVKRNYIGGRDVLDPQYRDYPADITPADKRHYFDPILVTDADGRAAAWLEPYRPRVAQATIDRAMIAASGDC
jgi:radical SAM superfamily enzyme YgiQ (UPF0313 family)